MGKRQVRILGKDLFAKADILKNVALTVILQNGSVYSGMLKEINEESFVLKDFHLNIHTFPSNAIVEIIADKEAAF